MQAGLKLIWTRLNDAEYLHLLLENFTLFGLGFGLLFFLASIALKAPKIKLLALGIIILSALLTYPASTQRMQTQKRVLAVKNSVESAPYKTQTQRRLDSRVWYLAVALIAILYLGLGKSKLQKPLLALTVLSTTIAILHSTWLHAKDSAVRFPNIQDNTPTKADDLNLWKP